MTAPQVRWEITHWDDDNYPTTWIAEFGAGYLVLHADCDSGNQTMVYVPHAVSGLGPQGDDEAVRP